MPTIAEQIKTELHQRFAGTVEDRPYGFLVTIPINGLVAHVQAHTQPWWASDPYNPGESHCRKIVNLVVNSVKSELDDLIHRTASQVTA